VTFVDEKSGNATQDIETVLSADQAATYTMESTLGAWASTAANDAKQAVCDLENIEDDGIYLVETPVDCWIVNGSTLKEILEGVIPVSSIFRKANARGGFGLPAGEEHQGVENTASASNEQVKKMIRDGKVVIVRGEKEYSVFGQTVK
jgi:hypothetical protein